MPTRNLKPSIRTSERLNKLTDFQFRLWVHLITYVDDYGRGDARLKVVKGSCFPLRDRITLKDVGDAMNELAGAGCIILYEVDGRPYLCFPSWKNHQRIQSAKSDFPEPPEEAFSDSRLFTVSHGESPWVTVEENQENQEEKREESPLSSPSLLSPTPPIIIPPIIPQEEKKEENPDCDNACAYARKAGNGQENGAEMKFGMFWDAYGNKKGKKNAFRSFQRINPDDKLFQKIMDGVERYHKSRKWREGYRKEPATWLNGECWNDEYEDESEVNSNGRYSNDRGKPDESPRTVYNLKPRFAGHVYDADGNDITPAGN